MLRELKTKEAKHQRQIAPFLQRPTFLTQTYISIQKGRGTFTILGKIRGQRNWSTFYPTNAYRKEKEIWSMKHLAEDFGFPPSEEDFAAFFAGNAPDASSWAYEL